MIKITSIDGDGKVVHREYDNKTTKFYQNGKITELDLSVPSPSGGCETYSYEDNPDTPPIPEEDWNRLTNNVSRTNKENDPSVLKIQMGLTCNYNCSYCIQGQFATKGIISNDDVDKFIDNFDTWCKSKKDQPIQIQLWGGEPLLYWDCVERLVLFFKTRFDNPVISVVTNGSLITKEIADFFITHEIEVAVSHDGPTNLNNRTTDPLAEGSDSLKWIKYINDYESRDKGVGFNAVITKDNPDIVSVVEYIKGIMGDKCSVGFEGIVTVETEDIFVDCMEYTPHDYLVLRENIIRGLADGSLAGIAPFQQKFDGLLFDLFNTDSDVVSGSFQKCGMDNPYTLGLNLYGDVLKCHSTTDKIGHVDDLENVDLYSGVTRWEERDCCMECPVLSLCKGACMLVDEKSWKYTCNNEFNFNMAIFEAVFQYVFKEKIVRIDGLDSRP